MECKSRAMVKLSTAFEELSVVCEYGSSALNLDSSAQEFLLVLGSSKFEDGSPAVIVGKDSEDEALMLEVEESQGDIRWTSFILEEALVFTVELVNPSPSEPPSASTFYLGTQHDGEFKYVCRSVDRTLLLSSSCQDMLSFEVIELFEPETATGPSSKSAIKQQTTKNTVPVAAAAAAAATPTSALQTTSQRRQTRASGAVYHSGTLMKKGDDMLGKWKPRFFEALNEADHFRVDYYEKEGGAKKGSIDCSGCVAVKSTAPDEKFGVLLVPPSRQQEVAASKGRGKGGGGARLYRLKAANAEEQAEWLHVFSRACEGGRDSPLAGVLTAESLSESSRARTRSADSAGSLSISIPQDDVLSGRFACLFAEGPLGMTMKRRTSGVVYIATVEEGTQASSHGLKPGCVVWSIGSMVVGGTVVDKDGWSELVGYIKQTPRPIEMVFEKPQVEVSQGTEDRQVEGVAVAAQRDRDRDEECSSTKSGAFSLVDFPANTPPAPASSRLREPSPSLQSLPSSGSLQSLDTSGTGSGSSGVVLVQSQHQEHQEQLPKEYAGGAEKRSVAQESEEERDIERIIVEDLAKILVFKGNEGSGPAPASGKGWRGSTLGSKLKKKAVGAGGVAKPAFELVQDGRRLAYEGQLFLLSKRALWQVKIPKMLYLFNDMLIVAVPAASTSAGGETKYTVEQVVDLMTCKVNCRVAASHEMVEGNIEADKRPLLWELLHPPSAGPGSGSLVFLCSSAVEQQKWVQHLAHCICERVAELSGSSALGVGWRHQYVLGTMHAAVLHRDQAQVVNLLESFAEGEVEEEALEGSDEDGYTPLHYATILRLPDIVRLLQESSADVSAQDRRGLTPLHWAALQLDVTSLERLCTNIMDVDLEDHKGRTPLHLACVEGRAANGRADPAALLACITTLLTYGANPDKKDDGGLCVLHHLSASWQYPAVELLLDGFANPLAKSKRSNCANVNTFDETEGWTALHYVCSTQTLQHSVGEGQQIMQSVHAESSAPSSSSSSSSAVRGAGLRTLLTLLEHGALPNMTTFSGHTPLSLLALATVPRPSSAAATGDNSAAERWAGSYDSAIVMLLSNGARLSFLNPSTGLAVAEPPPHWNNPAVRHSVEEGTAAWAKTEQLNGDAAGLKLKCYEQRKCMNAVETADMRLLAARMSEAGAAAAPVGGATPCLLCLTPFSMFRRQHHCRLCDALCCGDCSKKRVVVDKEPVRVCDTCFCLSKRRVETVLTEQFFSGQGAQQDSGSQKAELLQGSRPGDPTSKTAKTAGGVSGTMATMNDTKLQLQERGEKLQNLGDKSEKLANASSEFANMAKLLKEQQKSSWW